MNDEHAGHLPWGLSSDDAVRALQTRRKGLSEAEAAARRKKYGDNIIVGKKQIRALNIFLKQFASPLIFVLIGASILTIILQEWVDTAVIVLAVLVNVSLAFYQEYRAEHTIEKLSSYIKERTRVLRDGVEHEIDAADLVPGDIIRLASGARTPADGRIISENSLAVDEAILTGESLPVQKNSAVLSEGTALPERTNMVFAGTMVTDGYATVVVTATGGQTELGKIAEMVLEAPQERTPLQKGLWRLAWIIFFGILFIIAGVFALGVSRGEPTVDMLLIAAAVAVGAIPEALPIALTVILSVGAERIAKVKGIIRSLAAAETLGSASVVMTDKTGTLTMADMQLVGVAPCNDMLRGAASHEYEKLEAPERRRILSLAIHNTDITIENPEEKREGWVFTGKAMEVGIARALARFDDFNLPAFMATHRPPALAFNSTNKFSVSDTLIEGRRVVIGAPDVLLKASTISKDEYVQADAWIRETSEGGTRLLGVALLPKDASKHTEVQAQSVQNLEFLGTLIFRDPLRPEAVQAVKRIEKLGARVVMLTGDLKGTAVAIARELGWDISEGDVLSGDEVRALSDEELIPLLSHIKIFARVTPEDKLRIGVLYHAQGEVVAMTGDGVNDAPALKAVDIGVALGSGSDVAKSAADLVLLDDNFTTIVAAIEEGRRMLANIRKSFVYLMSNSLDEVILIGGALLAGAPLPLTALQIIWVNFFTGSWPALSFAFDGNDDGLDKPKKTKNDKVIFNREVKALTLGIGVLTSLLLLALYLGLLHIGMPIEEARTLLFICFASYILVVAFSFRSLTRPIYTYPIFSNKFLTWSVFGAGALLLATITIPPLQELFGLVPLPAYLWLVVIGWLAFNIVIVELVKQAFRKEHTTA